MRIVLAKHILLNVSCGTSQALHYSADLRRSLMDLADSHAALLMALEPLMDAGRGADVEELEGIAAASFTAARVGEAASQVL